MSIVNYPPECLLNSWRLNLLDEGFVQSPYPYFRFLRDCQPLHRLANGSWVVTRYDDVKKLLMHPCLGNSPSLFSLLNARNNEKYNSASLANNMIAFQDGDSHRQLRKHIMVAFNQPIKSFELPPVYLQNLLQQLLETKKFSAIKDLGVPVALTTIADLLGIKFEALGDDDQTRFDSLKLQTQDALYLFSQIPSHKCREKIDISVTLLRDQVRASLENHTQTSVVLSNFKSLIESGSITQAQAIDNIILLLVDGAENVDNLIASMLLWFKKYNSCAEAVLNDRSLVPSFVEECLRFETPVQFVGRVVQVDMELHDLQLRANQSVLLILASANRDNAIYENPDIFSIHRENNRAMTFGRGSHTCLGNQLVRKIMCAVLNGVLDVMPDYQIEANNIAKPDWQSRLGHRWVEDYYISC